MRVKQQYNFDLLQDCQRFKVPPKFRDCPFSCYILLNIQSISPVLVLEYHILRILSVYKYINIKIFSLNNLILLIPLKENIILFLNLAPNKEKNMFELSTKFNISAYVSEIYYTWERIFLNSFTTTFFGKILVYSTVSFFLSSI